MLNFNKPVFKIFEELCEELEIELDEYSFGLIKQLKKDGKVRNIVMYKFDLNSVASTEITNDKYATFEILRSNKIPIIEHHMIFNPKTRKDYITPLDLEIAKGFFDKNNGKIVIKANDSSQGKEVYLVENKDDIKKTILDIFSRNNNSLSICPYEDIVNEYRVIVLENECLFSYKKERPKVIGDGIKTIEDFVQELKIEKPDRNLDFNYIPKAGEEVCLNWKFNLSGGALPKKIEDLRKKEEVEKIALKSTKAINIKFCSVDIVETVEGSFKVIEVNGTVCMNKFSEKFENGYEISKDIYRKAILKMFE